MTVNNQRGIINLIREISGQANVLTIPRIYILMTKSHRAALLLSQSVYWSDKTRNPAGWFYKTYKDWEIELGLNRGAVDTALRICEKWIETDVRRVGPTPKKHYRVRFDLLVSDISDLLETDKSDLSVSGNSDLMETVKTDLPENSKTPYTEITPDITNHIGAEGAPPAAPARPATGANKPPAPQPQPTPARAPDPMFDAIVKVCNVDTSINGNGASVGKVRSALLGAKPPYTPADVLAWGKTQQWRKTPPTVWQLKSEIGSIRNPQGQGAPLPLSAAEEWGKRNGVGNA